MSLTKRAGLTLIVLLELYGKITPVVVRALPPKEIVPDCSSAVIRYVHVKFTGVTPTVADAGVGPLTNVANTPLVPEIDNGFGITLFIVVADDNVMVTVTTSLAIADVGDTVIDALIPLCENW
jgi:hypothetical protein